MCWPGYTANDGDTTTWTYDEASGLLTRKEYADGDGTDYTYTPDGLLETRTWARNIATTYAYDDDTRELANVDYGDTGPDPDVEFDYTRLGQLDSVTDNGDGSDHAFDYSQWPERVTETISGGPFGGSFGVARTTDTSAGSRFTGFQISGPATYQASYGYDDYGRLAGVTAGPGLPAGGVEYGYMADGPTPVADLISQIDFLDGSQDPLARISRQYEPERDLLDYVENIWDPDGTADTVSKYDYANDALGRRTSVVNSGEAFAENRLSLWSYNDRNELTGSSRRVGTDPDDPGAAVDAEQFGYGYDPIGNRETYDAGTPPVTTEYFGNCLNQYDRADTAAATPVKQNYRYDADGNLTEAYVVGDMNCDGALNSFDIDPFILALTNPTQYAEDYPDCDILNADVNGDGVLNTFDLEAFVALLGSGNDAVYVKYTWNAENRLIRYEPGGDPQDGDTKVEFAYDYMGRRIEKQVYTWNDTSEQWDWTARHKFVWAGWLLLMELKCDQPDCGTGVSPVRSYTWGLDLAGQSGGQTSGLSALESAGGISGLLAVEDATVQGGPADYVFTYDGNGNVGQVLDLGAATVNAAIVARYEYDPYGNVVTQSGAYAAENLWRFSTKYWDDETGLGYWGYRYYGPRMGRWMSRDPLGEPAGPNLYAYVVNRPPYRIDALGHIDNGATSQPTSQSSSVGCCGPEIRAAIEQGLQGVVARFATFRPTNGSGCNRELMRVCEGILGREAWDIGELAEWGSADLNGGYKESPFGEPACATGACVGTLQWSGKCYRANEMNYILWGQLNRLCHDRRSEWLTPDGTDEHGLPQFRDCDGRRITGVIHTWFHTAFLVYAYRLGFDLHLVPYIPAAPAGQGTAKCRAAWARVGYFGGDAPTECEVKECGTGCCGEYEGWLSFQITGAKIPETTYP